MSISNFGLSTLTRYPGFGFGWANMDFAPSFGGRNSVSMVHHTSLNAGTKVRIVVRTLGGTQVQTVPETVRLRFRKKL